MPEIHGQKQQEISSDRCIMVCQHQSCQRHNSAEVLKAFESATQLLPDVRVNSSGCMGQCSTGPTVRVTPDEIWYCRVKPTDIHVIVEQHLKGGEIVEAMLNPRIHMRFSWG